MMEKVDVTFSRPRGIAIHAAAWLGRRGDWRSRHTGKTHARWDVRQKYPVRERLRGEGRREYFGGKPFRGRQEITFPI